MKKLVPALAALALSGCASITVNGYEIDQDTQAVTAAVMIAGGVLVYSLAEDDEPKKDQTNPGSIDCKIDLETGQCVN